MEKRKKGKGVLKAILNVLWSILLVVSLVAVIVSIFGFSLSENVVETMAFKPLHLLIAGGALAVILIVALIFTNLHRVRRAFMAFSVSAFVSSAILLVYTYFFDYINGMIGSAWMSIIANSTVAFKEFLFIGAALLFVLGAALMSTYFSIVAIKGGKHE